MKKIMIISIVLILIFLIGCSPNITCEDGSPVDNLNNCPEVREEQVQLTAERVARYWEQREFEQLYDLFIDDLKLIKNESKFIRTMNYLEFNESIVIRLDKVSKDSEDVYYAYYTVTSGLYDAKAPAAKLVWVNDSCKINMFGEVWSFDVDKDIAEKNAKLDAALRLIYKENYKNSLINYINIHLDNMNDGSTFMTLQINRYTYSNRFDKTYCSDLSEIRNNAILIRKGFSEIKSLKEVETSYNFFVEYFAKYVELETERYEYCIAHSSSSKDYHSKLISTKLNELEELQNKIQEILDYDNLDIII